MDQATVSEMMKKKSALKILLIGVGNAGNQLLNPAIEHGIEVFAINSSQEDLDSAVVDSRIKSYILGNDARGAAKNRAVALDRLKYNGKDLLTNIPIFSTMCTNADVIIVAGATAGGTGSGVSPSLIQLLQQMYPNKIFIFFGVLPRSTDSTQAQANSVACLGEIQNLNIPYLLGDLDYYKGISNDEAYKGIQQYFIDAIDVIAGKYLNKSPHGMIDENDMRTVISAPGYMSIYDLDKISQAQLDAESMQAMMIKKIKSSPAVEIMRDGIVREMAVIVNATSEASDASKAGDYTEITNYVGRPLAIFENYAIVEASTNQMILMMSGQTAPFNRISAMADIAKEWDEKFNKHRDYNIGQLVQGTTAGEQNIPSFLSGSNNAPVNTSVIDDFFKN